MKPEMNTTSVVAGDLPLLNWRTCFYMLLPSETYFETIKDMPPLTARAVPPGSILILLELIILVLSGKSNEWKLHSAVVSWSSTALYESFSLFLFRGLEFTLYQWTYDKYRLMTLPWNGFQTYLFALFTVEFCGYWWHRIGHEWALMWASHELHHSSDEFNMSVAFRNSAPMRFFRWMFYLPLAFLGVPTATMATHLLLGSIYNGIIHQHSVPKLGKLIPGLGHFVEFFFVTPSHHRVHHASNKYCIDKNYGQFMIIWDRLFGTFVEEKENEPLTFGTLTQPKSYDMAWLQVSSFVKVWEKFQSMDTFENKMKAIFYGPGWFPGTPRLGNPDDIPDVRGRAKYSPKYPVWLSIYLVINAFCVFYSYLDMAFRIEEVSSWVMLLNLFYIYGGFAAIGGLYDRQLYSPWLELFRIICILSLSNIYPIFSVSPVTTFVTVIQYLDFLACPFLLKYVQTFKEEEEIKEATVVESNGHFSKDSVASKQVNSSNGHISNASADPESKIITNGYIQNGSVTKRLITS